MHKFQSVPAPVATLWGSPQQSEQILPGVWEVHTASHGGIILSEERLATIEELSRELVSGVDTANLYLTEAREQAKETQADIRWIMAKLADTSAASDQELLTAVRFFGNFDIADREAARVFLEERARELGLLRNTIELQQEVERELNRIAYSDPLTGLPNRRQIESALSRTLRDSADGNSRFTYLMIDLDRFKSVNDTYGHAIGDAVLIEVGRRLIASVGEQGLCGRIGGDEFVVILPDYDDEECVRMLGDTIIAAISAPYDEIAKWIRIGASIGASQAPRDGRSTALLARSADLALLRAKEAGGNIVHCYEPRLHEGAEERRVLGLELEKALERGQFSLVFQPIVQAGDHKVCGAEVLLRWAHPRLGQISPAKFIPLAEDIGLMGGIGAWVIREAITESTRWPPSITVSINLSPEQLNEDLIADVIGALAGARAFPERVQFEVTESAFLFGKDRIDVLAKLQSLGTRIVLDDFGTGYSCVGYLARTSLSAIKVDRSFVRASCEGKLEATAIIKAVVALADTLGIMSVAEGVEDEDQVELMRELGFTQLQGYYFGRPMVAEDFARIVGSRTPVAE